MHVVILSARTGWHTDELCRALAERGHLGEVVPYEGLVARLGTRRGARHVLVSEGAALFGADAVLARIIPNGSLEQIIFRVDALHWLEETGVVVVNSPRAIERCIDKFYTTALLQEAGLPTPETIACERTADALAAVETMGDVILKPIFGSMGHGMVRVSDPDVAFRVVRALEQVRAVYYVQRTIDHGGRDVRAFVLNGRVLGAIERRATNGDWRTNISRGGIARALELPPAWEALAIAAARVVGAEYAGVDLLPAQDGTVYVLEVNGIPGWQGLQRATSIDVAGALVDYVSTLVARQHPAPGLATSPAAIPAAAKHARLPA
jgi:RimK family alpha-L-glutamate ligase